jgi:hypothetical protein
MFIEPGVQVNPVENAAPSEANMRDLQLREQGCPDPQVRRRLFLGKTPHRRQRQAVVFHRRLY